MVNLQTRLTELKIDQNNFKSAGAIALAEYLKIYDQLETLEIKGCRIENDEMLALIESLKPSA